MDGDPIADESRVEGFSEIAGHRHDAAQIGGGGLQPAADLPQEDDQEGVGEDHDEEGEGSLGLVGDHIRRRDPADQHAPCAGQAAEHEQPEHDAAGNDRGHDDRRQERGDRHRGGQ